MRATCSTKHTHVTFKLECLAKTKILTLLNMQFSPVAWHLLPLGTLSTYPSSRNVKDQVWHPHITRRPIIVHLSVSLSHFIRRNHRDWTLQNVHFIWNGINERQYLWRGNVGVLTCKGSSTLSAVQTVDMRQQNHTVAGTSDELICRKWNPLRFSCRCVHSECLCCV